MKILSVVGARPNFMKIASVISAIDSYNQSSSDPRRSLQHRLVHTGQHYDEAMSAVFFRDLDLPPPDLYLGVGSASHALQTAEIMKRLETVLMSEQPDLVLLVGDVNSTLAGALVASKLAYGCHRGAHVGTRPSRRRPLIAHVEAGLRSFDRAMPEEVNRVLTDAVADVLFTTEESANENLRNEGVPDHRIYFVGNTMIDTLLRCRLKAQSSEILARLQLANTQGRGSESRPYAVLTLHRPHNVDDRTSLLSILKALSVIAEHLPIIFPCHPRTLARIRDFGYDAYFAHLETGFPRTSPIMEQGLYCLPPLGYLDFVRLMSHARLVFTDSGGIQEESTILGIPCVTLRQNTERPVTVSRGTNVLAGTDTESILRHSFSQLQRFEDSSRQRTEPIPTNSVPLWDGFAGRRIVATLTNGILQ